THSYLREEILAKIQKGECDAPGGLNTIDYIDEVEEIADKMKNLVKAGSHKFVYNHNYNKEAEDEEKESETETEM
ncbi:MAG TPA: Na/Pi cotransporter family protein, partial [Candidatus Cloacimonas sp.]|nr:Na/Pi cotransporter family protein [Candidatus Cloacimonas sp.]